MTAMNTQSTKSLPNSQDLVKVTGNPCLQQCSLHFRTAGSGPQLRDITRPNGRAMISATELSRRQMLSEVLIQQAAIQSP